ncbi:MAG: hypothetical protein NTW54_07190 [Bacteroidetes bacterium]|nr:hypothetical protein [Bacteroidota bacterium]
MNTKNWKYHFYYANLLEDDNYFFQDSSYQILSDLDFNKPGPGKRSFYAFRIFNIKKDSCLALYSRPLMVGTGHYAISHVFTNNKLYIFGCLGETLPGFPLYETYYNSLGVKVEITHWNDAMNMIYEFDLNELHYKFFNVDSFPWGNKNSFFAYSKDRDFTRQIRILSSIHDTLLIIGDFDSYNGMQLNGIGYWGAYRQCPIVGILNTQNKSSLTVYPNPVTNQLNINYSIRSTYQNLQANNQYFIYKE